MKMKLQIWCSPIVMVLAMLVGEAAFAVPPIEFAPGNSVITVRVPTATGIVTVQVGRPSSGLWQFLYTNNTRFAALQLDDFETLLVRNLDGSAVTSSDVYTLASRTWQINHNLVPIGSDYGMWRTTAQQVRDTIAQEQLITPVVEGLEFVRDTGFKAEIAIAASAATGGAAAPAVLQKTVAEEALGYLKSSAIDGVMFGQKSQRASAWIWGAAYIWAKDRQLETVNDLSAGVIDYDFEKIASRMGAANLCSFSDSRFIPWRLSLYDVGTSFWDSLWLQTQGMITDEAISLIGEQLDNSAMATALESSGSTMAYFHLGQAGGKVVENLFTIDTMVEAWWAAQDSGIFGQPSLQGSPFANFVDGIVTDCKPNGTVWRYGQAIAQAPLFQKYLVETLYLPGPITNLSAQVADYTSVNLTWTAPADDMGAKGVANHEIRYSDTPIVTETDWNKAIRLDRSTGPASIGQSMTVNTGDLQPSLRRYFAVRAVDDQGNQGPISTCPSIVVGTGVNPISLTGDSVCPNPASAISSAHSYLVTYTHAGGRGPTMSRVVINGSPHTMDYSGNPKNGLLCQCSDMTPYASGSTVLYHFEFQAGSDSKRLPATSDFQLPVDSALYGNTVTPATADSVVLRTFQVWYRNPLGTPPTRSQLRLANSAPINMRLVKGAPTIGALYEAGVYVSTVAKNYWFDFSDGTRDFRLPAAGSYSVGVTSNLDVAVIGCAMPTNVTCGQIIPVRPQLRNVGTVLAQNCDVYLLTNGVSFRHVIVPMLEPGMTRSGAAAFDWTVPVSDVPGTYTVQVGITPLPGEGATGNNAMSFVYSVPAGRGKIVGYTYDSLGVIPVTNALVQAFSGTNDAGSAISDDTGYFVIDGLTAGSYQVRGEKDGQAFSVSSVAVHALQTADLGSRQMSGAAATQHTSLSSRPYTPRCSLYDGTVACWVNTTNPIYLMKEDGSNFHPWLSENYTANSRFSAGFSPTRREFVFSGVRNSTQPHQTGIFRCQYDANANFVSITLILSRDSFGDSINNPVYLPDGEHILFWSFTSNEIWQIDRNGGGLTKKVSAANLAGLTSECAISPDGTKVVDYQYVYLLDLDHALVTNIWAVPLASGILPTFSPDGSRIVYKKSGTSRIFMAVPLSDADPMQLTFDPQNYWHSCLSRTGDRLYYVYQPLGGTPQLWSRPVQFPALYGAGFTFSNGISILNPITLDADGTNDSCTLTFKASTNGLLTANVYDCQSRLVRSICKSAPVTSGTNSVTWDANGDDDLAVPLGVYALSIQLQQADGGTNAPFSYQTYVPVVYEMASIGRMGWTAFGPDDRVLYFSDPFTNAPNNFRRYDLQTSTSALVSISNVYSFDVNEMGIIAAHTNNDGGGTVHFSWYGTNGVPMGTWVTSADARYDGIDYNFPSAHPKRQEFIFGDTLVVNGAVHGHIYKATGPSAVSALTSSTNWECTAVYSPTGSNILYTVTTSAGGGSGINSVGDIYEMKTDGSAQTRKTTNPKVEVCPKYIPGSARMLFKANWVLTPSELWCANMDGSNPWWLLPSIESYDANYDITTNADLLAVSYGGSLKLIALPEHLNKGAVHGRVIDDQFGAGLADVPIRAVQGSFVGSATRSNGKGYFKLINLPAGAWIVVAGGGAYLQTAITNVSMAVASVAEVGSIAVTPSPGATLNDPAANSTVAPLFAVKAEPSERCAYAQFQWRRNTNNTWTSATMLASSNQYATMFSATAAGWTNGSYSLRVAGVNTNGVIDPNPTEVTVVYQPSSSPLTLTLDTTGGGTNLFALRTAKPTATNDLAVLVYEVKYGGDTNWLELGTTLSTNAADKQFNAALVPLGVATQYRVKNYDSVGNVSTSSVVTLTRTIPGDSDSDGIPDWWMIKYFGHPTGQASDHSLAGDNPAHDGLNNLQKYLLGLNPLVWDNLWFGQNKRVPGVGFDLEVYCAVGSNYVLRASTNLVNWTNILIFSGTNWPMHIVDPAATNYNQRFYRAVVQ
jgi:hypothetical protein